MMSKALTEVAKVQSYELTNNDHTKHLAVVVAAFIDEKKLFTNIQGKKYVNVSYSLPLLQLPMERFYFLKCLPQGYMISSFGRVKSLNRTITRRDGKQKNFKERIIKTQLNELGYEVVYLKATDQKKKAFKVHRLVALAFVINHEQKAIINHKDGNKLNNHYSNLEWCDHSHNLQHAYDNNLRTFNTEPANAARRKRLPI